MTALRRICTGAGLDLIEVLSLCGEEGLRGQESEPKVDPLYKELDVLDRRGNEELAQDSREEDIDGCNGSRSGSGVSFSTATKRTKGRLAEGGSLPDARMEMVAGSREARIIIESDREER